VSQRNNLSSHGFRLRKPNFPFLKVITEAIDTVTSRQKLKSLYGVSLYRNAIYLMLNSAMLALTGFFFWVIAARLYPVEGVGLASAAISAIGLLALLSTLGLDYGLIRFLPNAGEKASKMINSCFTLGALLSIILALIFLAGLNIWSPALLPIREHPVFFAGFVIFTIANLLTTLLRQTFIAQRKAKFAFIAHGLIFGLLRFIPVVILAGTFRTFGIFASWGIALAVAILIGTMLLLPHSQIGYRPLPAIEKGAISDMMHFSSANYSANIFWAIPSLILPLMVVNLLGAEQNAYFYIAWAISTILFWIPVAASLSLFAEGSHDEEKLGENFRKSLKLTFFLLIPAIAIIFLLGNKILLLFGTAYSENATKLLQILAISALPLSLNYIYFSVKRVEMRMKEVIGLSAFIAVATLALSFFLLPRIGILGAGVSYLVAQVIATSIIGFQVSKTHHRREV